ncbi:MAG: hypothetical protein IH930_04295 [Proteobacteria bacterium]|nr:hypothetical protein [Pseudomonadota bacterium]
MNENQSFDDKLMEAARALETEVAPEHDLWPNIENAIARPSRTRWNTVFAQAAAVLLLVGASSGLTYLAMNEKTPVATLITDNTGLNYERASFGGHYTLGPGYQDARSGLRAQLEEELERLSPEARAEVEKNLNAIRAAINEINRALADEPDNVLLQELLLSTYREELSVMIKVDRVVNAAMLRTDI